MVVTSVVWHSTVSDSPLLWGQTSSIQTCIPGRGDYSGDRASAGYWLHWTLNTANMYRRTWWIDSFDFHLWAFTSQLVIKAANERVRMKHHVGKCSQIVTYSIGMVFQPVCQSHRSFCLPGQTDSRIQRQRCCPKIPYCVLSDLPHGLWPSTLSTTSCFLMGKAEGHSLDCWALCTGIL